MDPQQRLLLMAAAEAMSRAPPSPPGAAMGVFVGASALDYSRLAARCVALRGVRMLLQALSTLLHHPNPRQRDALRARRLAFILLSRPCGRTAMLPWKENSWHSSKLGCPYS